jgi:hypothetical protein
MSTGGRNAKRPWWPEDDIKLRELAAAGKTVAMIALQLKRTVPAVRTRSKVLKISVSGRRNWRTKQSGHDGVLTDRRRD